MVISLALFLALGVFAPQGHGQMMGEGQSIVLSAILTATQEVPAPAEGTPATVIGSGTLLIHTPLNGAGELRGQILRQ